MCDKGEIGWMLNKSESTAAAANAEKRATSAITVMNASQSGVGCSLCSNWVVVCDWRPWQP